MPDHYKRALKRGEKEYRAAVASWRQPNLPVFDALVSEEQRAGEERVGTCEIPLDMVVGTKTEGRARAFSCGFMPLLDAESELAAKWNRLYAIQEGEGFRDPVIAFEFMHRFYVQEGNKRVSVLKYLDAPSVTAEVTRVLPRSWEGHEARLYGEFLRFFACVPLYEVSFSREGGYFRLAEALGMGLDAPWPEDDVRRLRASYARFKQVWKASGGDATSFTEGDALLVYLGICPDEKILTVPQHLFCRRVAKLVQLLTLDGSQVGPWATAADTLAKPVVKAVKKVLP